MRRAAPTLPVTPTMLRHFAVVTLVATAGLAMFANGENTSALADAQQAARARGGGAWGTSPVKASETKGPRTVNGMKVAAGTRLDHNGAGNDAPEDFRVDQQAQGDIRNLDPEFRSLPAGSLGSDPQAGAAAPTGVVPAPIQRDRNGVPLPPGSAGQAASSANAKPPPPRRANREDIERMMEASRLRSSAGSAGSGESLTPDDS